MTLFGEGAYDRRERLRFLLSTRQDIPQKLMMKIIGGDAGDRLNGDEDDSGSSDGDEEFFTVGSDELLECRRLIAKYSLQKSKERLQKQRGEQSESVLDTARRNRRHLYSSLETVGLYATQIGSDRPLSTCAFSPSSVAHEDNVLLTGCFGGTVKMWSTPDCQLLKEYRGHQDRIGEVRWNPANSGDLIDFASCASDGSISLWNRDRSEPVIQLNGHALRVSSIDFHPSGKFLASAGYDYSWRLWDVETEQELLLQEGHSREVSCIRFQHDGSLVASGSQDGWGRVWDLRSGRAVMLLQGHVQAVHALDWNPNSFQIATGSADHTVRIHDLRQLKCSVNVLAAHGNLVNSVKYRYNHNAKSQSLQTYNGDYLVTASFDQTAKIWGCGDYKCINTLGAHSNKVMAMDISADGSCFATASYDRTFKLWIAGAL